MKQIKSLVAVALLALGGLVACKTTSTYQSIAATETAVLAFNAAYLDSVVTGVTPTNSVPTIEAIFNDTQLALHAAAAVASGGMNAPVPAATAVKAQNFTNTVATLIGKK